MRYARTRVRHEHPTSMAAVTDPTARPTRLAWRWAGRGGRVMPLPLLLNGPWHGRAIAALLLLTAAHWTEHVLQAVQVYVLGWPRAQALGGLGLAFPELVTSEWLHFSDVVATLAILALLRPAFVGQSRRVWNAAIVLETWHAVEHVLLLGQALTHTPLFGATVPTSLVQLIVPRLELHLVYNAIVLVPMSWAIWVHCTRPAPAGAGAPLCGCRRAFARLVAGTTWRRRSAAVSGLASAEPAIRKTR